MKTVLLYAFRYLPWAICFGLFGYIGRLRKEIQRRVRENAAATMAVLRNYVIVNGVQLPRPEDERWKETELTIELTHSPEGHKKITSPALQLGPVAITGNYLLPYGENGIYVNNAVLPDTPATAKYAATVWATQRSRVIREALEKGET